MSICRIVDLDQAAALAAHVHLSVMIGILEGREHMAVGQAEEAVRHAEPAEAFERSGDAGFQRIVHIDDHRPVGVMVIGEQHAARRHFIFAVMGVVAFLVGADARDQLAISSRSGIGVDDDDEVVPDLRLVPAPHEQIMTRLVGGPGLYRRRQKQGRQKDCNAAQHWLSP